MFSYSLLSKKRRTQVEGMVLSTFRVDFPAQLTPSISFLIGPSEADLLYKALTGVSRGVSPGCSQVDSQHYKMTETLMVDILVFFLI